MADDIFNLGISYKGSIASSFSSFMASVPPHYQIIFNIFIYTVLIALYSIFVFQFYRFLARRNIIRLNLSQYNTSDHPSLNKFLATLFFLLEYIIILPILVFFWFAILSFLLMLLSGEQTLSQILLVSAAVVGAIRVTSYFNENLSQDLAKMFPFTVLAIFLLNPGSLNFSLVLDKLTEIPSFFQNILYYLIFVICFEILIRVIYSVSFLFKHPDEQEEEEIEEELKDEK